MSRKLATTIKDSAIPGKYKRVLEAYAAFANNDGTNIRPSQRQLAGKAGTSPDTVQRNTPDLISSGILKHATSHTCKVKECHKGATHFTGTWGRWTLVYNLDISCLQSAVNYLAVICGRVNAAKCRKVKAANCGTTQALPITPAPSSLGMPINSSALTSGSEKGSKLFTPPRPASPKKGKATPTPQGLEFAGEAKANQPQEDPDPNNRHPVHPVEENFWTEEVFTDRGELLFNITPKPSVAAIEKGLPICDLILAHFDDVDEDYRGLAATMVLNFNRAHRSHNYATKDDKKLCIRTAEQFLKALESDNATLLNDYLVHDFENCELCVNAGVVKYRPLIFGIINDKREKEERKRKEAARLAEEARLAKLCFKCKKVPFGSMSLPGGMDIFTNGVREVLKRVCDQCYDAAFEFQQKSGMHVREVLTARPGYLEAKRAAAAEASSGNHICAICRKSQTAPGSWSYCAGCDPAKQEKPTAPEPVRSRIIGFDGVEV
jgi:hypothetical protein